MGVAQLVHTSDVFTNFLVDRHSLWLLSVRVFVYHLFCKHIVNDLANWLLISVYTRINTPSATSAHPASAGPLEERISRTRASGVRVRPQAQCRTGAHRRVGAPGGSAHDGIGHRKKSLGTVEFIREKKRAVISMLTEEYPVSVVCEALGCARSSYYYRPAAPQEQGVLQALEEVAAAWPGMAIGGSRTNCDVKDGRSTTSG